MLIYTRIEKNVLYKKSLTIIYGKKKGITIGLDNTDCYAFYHDWQSFNTLDFASWQDYLHIPKMGLAKVADTSYLNSAP